jgi:hypothetical protein
VLDVDDTTLATWNYEIFSNWAFNPTTNATFVLGQLFPAVPGMVQMVNEAAGEGYAVLLPHGAAADAGGCDARQPHERRRRSRRRLPGADDAVERRGRPLHEAGGRRLPRLPEDGVRGRDRRRQDVHHRALQVGDPGAHRVARIRDRRQLRRSVLRPQVCACIDPTPSRRAGACRSGHARARTATSSLCCADEPEAGSAFPAAR